MLPTGKVLSEIARNTNLTPIRQATLREGREVSLSELTRGGLICVFDVER